MLGFLSAGIGCLIAVITNKRGVILLGPLLLFAVAEITVNFTLVGLSGGQSSVVFASGLETPMSVYCLIAGIMGLFIALIYAIYCNLLRRRLMEWQ